MKKQILLTIFIGLTAQLFSQRIISVELQETLSRQNLSFLFFGLNVQYGVEAYKVLYETTDVDGTTATASGLMVLPIRNAADQSPLPFLAYQHGTSNDRSEVPSTVGNIERRMIYFFASQGYFATAADYLGLGDSDRAKHPYLHAATEASAGIDLVKAAKSYLDTQGQLTNGQLFITGYSQGGHASMAMHRALEGQTVAGLEVAAASHMSGIYNLSGEILEASTSETVYNYPSFLVSIIVSYQDVYGNLYNDLSDIFLPEYVPAIQDFANGVIRLDALNGLLVNQLIATHGASIPSRLLTNTYLQSFQNNPSDPFRVALEANDLFNWVPNTPTRLLYCQADEIIPFTHSTFTASTMNANGATDVAASDVNSSGGHFDCVLPAVLRSVLFFNSLIGTTTTNTSGVALKVLLEGLYDAQTADMHTQLNDKGLLPLQQPFNKQPWNYTGTESVTTIPSEVVDWILVMTRDEAGTILDQAAGLLTKTGVVVSTEGELMLPIQDATNNYISIHHQSHLAVISSQPYDGQLYDFTQSATTAQGAEQLKSVNGKYVLFAGDYDGTGLINSLDFNHWKTQGAALNEYLPIDGDGNGIINNLDYNLWVKNRSKVGAPTIRY